jgi:hypothetical protein
MPDDRELDNHRCDNFKLTGEYDVSLIITNNNNNNSIQFFSIQFFIINVPSQQQNANYRNSTV